MNGRILLGYTTRGIVLGAIAFIFILSSVPAPVAKAASAPYFSITLVAPTSSPVRREVAQVIQNSYVSAGIQANLVYMGISQWLSLLFGNSTCPQGHPYVPGGGDNCPPPSYANGGWDAGFIGNGPQMVIPDWGTQNNVLYRGGDAFDFPPHGDNFYWWVNGTYNSLAADYGSNYAPPARLSDARQMVKIIADQRPGLVIEYPLTVYAWDPALQPWGTGGAISSSTSGLDWQHWATGSVSTVNAAVSGTLDSVSPLPTPSQNSYFDRFLYGPTDGAAQGGGGALEEANARGPGIYFDALANRVAVSADHLAYSVSFKPHTFQDGVAVSADDYLFTHMAGLIASVGWVGAAKAASILGSQDQFTFLNGTTDYVDNGVYQHGGSAPAGWTPTSSWKSVNATAFSFTLPPPYLFADPIISGAGALPMHILEQIPFAQWQSSPLSGFTGGCTQGQDLIRSPCPQGGLSQNYFTVTWNTARYGGNGSYRAYGPIGDGAYIYHGYSPVTHTGTLVRFDSYWNATGLRALHEFTVRTVNIISTLNKSAAIGAYGNPINFFDSQYGFDKNDTTTLARLGAKVVYSLDPANGWQEMPLNNVNPIWGTGTGTPSGIKDPAHASTYAKDVRAALSYLIPRLAIVDILYQGHAAPGITQFYPNQGVITPGDIYRGISPDPYNQTAALQYLAAAGYALNIPPPFCCGVRLPPVVRIGNATLNIPGLFLGNSLTLSGTFPLNPSVASWANGFYIALQLSSEGGKTWVPVSLGSARAGGS